MDYQYGQGFKKDLESLVELIKKENTIDFDPQFLEDEVKKILKYNKQKIIFLNNEKIIIEEFDNLSIFVSWFNKWDETYSIKIVEVKD